jgi:hypothetical protein
VCGQDLVLTFSLLSLFCEGRWAYGTVESAPVHESVHPLIYRHDTRGHPPLQLFKFPTNNNAGITAV